MKQKSQKLADKIKALNAELEAAKAAESETADRELLKLVHKAGIRDQMIQFARKTLDQQRAEK